MLSRRTFAKVSAVAGLGLLVGPLQARTPRRAETFFEWITVREGFAVALGQGGNSLVVMGKRGAGAGAEKGGGVLVDCKNAPYAKALRRESEARCGSLAAVLNTHHHGDHSGGNWGFVADVPTFAHEKATPRILGQMNRYVSQAKEAAMQTAGREGEAVERVRKEALAYYQGIDKMKPADFAPRTGVGDSHSAGWGGVKFELRHFGAGHTDNDVVVHVPELNVVHTGDLVFHKVHPFIDKNGGGNTAGWIESCRRALALCDAETVVVPGHGAVGNREAISGQIEYFERMREAVEKAVKEGKTRKETAEMDPGLFAEYGSKERRGMTLGALYDEMGGRSSERDK